MTDLLVHGVLIFVDCEWSWSPRQLSVCGTLVEPLGTFVALAQRRYLVRITERDTLEPMERSSAVPAPVSLAPRTAKSPLK